MLSGRINTYNRVSLPVCLSTPCLTLLLHRRPATIRHVSPRAPDSAPVQNAYNRAARFTAERTPAEALNSLQFAYPEINDEKGDPAFYLFIFFSLLNAVLGFLIYMYIFFLYSNLVVVFFFCLQSRSVEVTFFFFFALRFVVFGGNVTGARVRSHYA